MQNPLLRLGVFERRLLAFGLAPLGAGLAYLLVAVAMALVSDPPRRFFPRLDEALLGAGGVALYAAPFAWLAAPLVVGWLRRRGRADFLHVAASGALLGGGWFASVILVEGLDRLQRGRPLQDLGLTSLLVLVGAWCGIGAAAALWWIESRAGPTDPDSAPG